MIPLHDSSAAVYRDLAGRVAQVARLDRRCVLVAGLGRVIGVVGGALFAVMLLEHLVGLPLLLRALVLPGTAAGLVWLGWRAVLRPLLRRYGTTRAALLVEAHRPDLNSVLVSSLELYADQAENGTAFDPDLLRETVRLAERKTRGQNFRDAVDRRSARRLTAIAAGVLAVWGAALVLDAAGIGRAFGRMASAWLDIRDITRRVAGAEIVIEPPPGRPAFLRGEDVPLRVVQKGFHNARMALFLRPQGTEEWHRTDLTVGENGTAVHVAAGVTDTFECYGEAGQIRSEILTVIVTERPRIVKISVEYEFPAYVQRAPVVQTRSDGDLETLYGSTVLLTIEASKPVARAALTASHLSTPVEFSVGGPFAQGILGLDNPDWLERDGPVEERYRIRLVDAYGFENEDADHEYRLQVIRDQAPVINFVGLPHRSSAEEPHILERDIESIRLSVRARDDYGVSRVVLHYRIEDLETAEVRDSGSRVRPLGIPRAEVPHLALARLEELAPQLGERIVFWAEAEDAYDLEPETGVHITKTPVYRLAIVTEEELFAEIRYRDDWATYWYDDLKMATLARRAPPPRMAPAAEPAAIVAQRLLGALPATDTVAGDDRPLVEQYFESLIYE